MNHRRASDQLRSEQQKCVALSNAIRALHPRPDQESRENVIGHRDIFPARHHVRDYVSSDEYFMCSYADCLTDAQLDDMIDTLKQSKRPCASLQ
jgi:hypothetical protein